MIKDIDYKIINTEDSKYVFFRDTIQIFKLSDEQLISFLDNNLSERNKLFDNNTSLEIINSLKNVNSTNRQPKFSVINEPTTLVFYLTKKCNLNCNYCFVDKKTETEIDLDFNKAKEVILWAIENNFNSQGYNIVFFGGEPLLCIDIINQIIEFCNEFREKNNIPFFFSLTTNGTLFNSSILNLIKNNEINVIISIDGSENIHNKNRKFKNGLGSHTAVMKTINLFKKEKIKFSFRATITLNEDINDILCYFEDLRVPFYFEFELSSKKNDSINELTYNKIESCFLKISEYYLNRVMSNNTIYSNNIVSALYKIYHQLARQISCTAGRNYFAFQSDGEIFSCQYFAKDKGSSIGNVNQKLDQEKLKTYIPDYIDNTLICKDCCYKYLCTGGCFSERYLNNKDNPLPIDITCNLKKYFWESMILLFQNISERKPEFLESINDNLLFNI